MGRGVASLLVMMVVVAAALFVAVCDAGCAIEPDESGHVTIPSTTTYLADYSFSGCPTLKSVSFSTSVKTVGTKAFENCHNLARVVIPDSVTYIRYAAFGGCIALTSIDLGNTVEKIDSSAFRGCSSLLSLNIPDSVTALGPAVCRDCTALTSASLGDSLTTLPQDSFYSCSSLKTVTLSTSVVSLGYGSLRGCSSLTTITPLSSIVSIDSCAFYGCASLESLSFSDSLLTVGVAAMKQCTSLKSVHLGSSLKTAGASMLHSNRALESLTLPDSLTTISYALAFGCKSLKSLILGKYVKTIGQDAFHSCPIQNGITLYSSIESIGAAAFFYSSVPSLTVINASRLDIGLNTFHTSSLTKVNITARGHVAISAAAFYNCKDLVSMHIVSNSTSFDRQAVERATNLRTVVVHGTVDDMGRSAFGYNTLLETAEFPDGVRRIDMYAMASCSNLKSLVFNSLLEEVGNSAFLDCSKLLELKIDPAAPMSSLSSQFCRDCFQLKSFTVPAAVTKINTFSFYKCSKLASVTFSGQSMLQTIETQAFSYTGVTMIELPDSLLEIGSNAFYGSKITSLTVPASVSSVQSSAFAMSTKLQSLVILSASMSVGYVAFDKCPLSRVTLLDTAKQIETEEVPNIWCNGTMCACNEGFGGATAADVQGATTCTTCVPGRFAAKPRLGMCSPCPVGAYGVGTGLTVCTNCAIGKSTQSTSATAASACQACSTGRYSPTPGSACLPCRPGSYHSGEGASACTDCPAGRYNADTGSVSADSCVDCAAGKYSANAGAPSSASCVDCPAGLVPSSNTGSMECVIIPTSMPSAQPSSQPTTQPTGQPTSNPTVSESSMQTWTHDTLLSAEDIASGKGLHYVGKHTFTNLGQYYDKFYLSLFVYDTGFGPIKAGEYVQFFVNNEVVTEPSSSSDGDGSVKEVLCAPVIETEHVNTSSSQGCQRKFQACAFNVDVTSKIKPAVGGSLDVTIKSYGVLSSACPYIDPATPDVRSVVFARYVISAVAQNTPTPTFPPTEAPTKDNLNVFNGLQLDINSLDVWVLLQISVSVGLIMGLFGAFLTNIRKKAEKSVYQHPLAYSAVVMAFAGTELTSMMFLILKLVQYGFSPNAITLGVFRILQLMTGGLIVMCLFGPTAVQERGDLKRLIDHDHLTAESKIYVLVALFCPLDASFTVFLPWRDSRFAMLSKGFPCLWVWRMVNVTTIVSVIVSLGCQIPFLLARGQKFSADRDLVFVLNIFLLAIKTAFVLGEFFYKHNVLTTDTAEFEARQSEIERGEAGVSMIEYVNNPLRMSATGAAGGDGDSESDPLLSHRLMVVEEKTSRISEIEGNIALLLSKIESSPASSTAEAAVAAESESESKSESDPTPPPTTTAAAAAASSSSPSSSSPSSPVTSLSRPASRRSLLSTADMGSKRNSLLLRRASNNVSAFVRNANGAMEHVSAPSAATTATAPAPVRRETIVKHQPDSDIIAMSTTAVGLSSKVDTVTAAAAATTVDEQQLELHSNEEDTVRPKPQRHLSFQDSPAATNNIGSKSLREL